MDGHWEPLGFRFQELKGFFFLFYVFVAIGWNADFSLKIRKSDYFLLRLGKMCVFGLCIF